MTDTTSSMLKKHINEGYEFYHALSINVVNGRVNAIMLTHQSKDTIVIVEWTWNTGAKQVFVATTIDSSDRLFDCDCSIDDSLLPHDLLRLSLYPLHNRDTCWQ